MTAGEEADQKLMRRLLLTHDDLRQLALDPATAFVDLLDDLAFTLEDLVGCRHDRSFVPRNGTGMNAD
jgi:hypothetical protein